MTLNYLKRYYLEDHKLSQRARLEFFRALSTGRVVAFVGSMATEAFGYGNWKELKDRYFDTAKKNAKIGIKGESDETIRIKIESEIANFRKYANETKKTPKRMTDSVAMNMADESLDRYDKPFTLNSYGNWPLDQHSTLREGVRVKIAQHFRQRYIRSKNYSTLIARPDNIIDHYFDTLRALWTNIGIRRFATTNYDFELERVAMLADQKSPDQPFASLQALKGAVGANFSWDLGSGHIRRTLPDGWGVESDLLNRERIDQMVEFAVGADDVDGHIMHLHGRACNWRSMIIHQRDYDNLYRRNDLNRAPFEFAKRMLFGGNPILFVGLGMSEAELNAELQEFISNNPYRRAAPTFLLWSAYPNRMDAPARAAMRLDYLRRLGVFVIFDSDLTDHEPPRKPNSDLDRLALTESQRWLADLKSSVDDLAQPLMAAAPNEWKAGQTSFARIDPTRRESHVGKKWRSMEGRVQAATAAGQHVELFSSTEAPQVQPTWLKGLARKAASVDMMCVIGHQGCGKGFAARLLARDAKEHFGLASNAHCMLINGGFCFDTDTVLDGVAHFFSQTMKKPFELPDGYPTSSRASYFRRLNLSNDVFGDDNQAFLIINGMERFFDVEGKPLSAELDQLLNEIRGKYPPTTSNKLRQRRVRVLMFGTERVRQYMNNLNISIAEFGSFSGDRPTINDKDGNPDKDEIHIQGWYLSKVWSAARLNGVQTPEALKAASARHDALAAGKISGDSVDLRRAMFGAIFDEENLAKIIKQSSPTATDSPTTTTARHIMRALAFAGLAVESRVLALMPGLKESSNFDVTLQALIEAHLVLEVHGYRAPNSSPNFNHRYVLHRSLLTELRYRYGIPLNEAKLSTAFNMSLFVAQPIDGDIPDTDIHDDLGLSIDRLIGSYWWKNEGDNLTYKNIEESNYKKILHEVALRCGASELPHEVNPISYKRIEELCSLRHSQSLRAALALARSYYSTTGLLTLDSGDRLIREGGDGVLLEHAERLDNLIDGYGKRSLARQALRERLHDETAFREHFDDAEPFYADELVWLHNERGVVRLAMGDLYEARRSFVQAMRVNREWVERDDRAHNWRRIRLNNLLVDIEMGDLGVAERKCEEIRALTLNSPRLREDELALAIVDGCQAWCLQLRGRMEEAIKLFENASEALTRLGEVRAQAFFGRLHADALARASRPEQERRAVLERALSLAQSSRQMDIVHRIQVSLADAILFDRITATAEERKLAHRYLEEALNYALHTDVHRVRCEASMVTARARLQMSDFEGALRYASDAMMIATRYGMELRKISLRALIAKIMAARGHPVTAEHLARTCIKMATRRNYQTAIDAASQVIMENPRISAAISTSDHSGRRHF